MTLYIKLILIRAYNILESMDDVNEVTYDNPDEIQICDSFSAVCWKLILYC